VGREAPSPVGTDHRLATGVLGLVVGLVLAEAAADGRLDTNAGVRRGRRPAPYGG
jgi:hypothetical protein